MKVIAFLGHSNLIIRCLHTEENELIHVVDLDLMPHGLVEESDLDGEWNSEKSLVIRK